MSKKCSITSKKTAVGYNVSHAMNHTKRKFYPNLTHMYFYSNLLKSNIRLKVTQKGRRNIEHKGGIDTYILDTPNRALTPILKTIKKNLLKKSNA